MEDSSELFRLVKLYEENRLLKSRNIYERNRKYWKELRKIQFENISDSKLLLDYYKSRHLFFKQTINFTKGNFPSISSEQKGNAISQSVGTLTLKVLLDYERSFEKSFIEAIENLEKDVIIPYENEIISFEKELHSFEEKGKILFIAMKLIDKRTSMAFNNYINLKENDSWLIYSQYFVSVEKHIQIVDMCNKQFKHLFDFAKKLESFRFESLTRFAELFSLKISSFYEYQKSGCKLMTDTIKNIPNITSNNLGSDLSKRVSSEVQNYANSINNIHSNHSNVSVDANISEIPYPLMLNSLKRLFLFSIEEPGIILSSWKPVLVSVTATKWVHIFSLFTQDNLSPPLSKAFADIITFPNLIFEEEIKKNIDGQEKDRPIPQGNSFSNICTNVASKDLDSFSNDETFEKLIVNQINEENLLVPLHSINPLHATYSLSASPIPAESLITIVEIIPPTSFDFFYLLGGWSSEKRITLKAKNKEDMTEFMSLIDKNNN